MIIGMTSRWEGVSGVGKNLGLKRVEKAKEYSSGRISESKVDGCTGILHSIDLPGDEAV